MELLKTSSPRDHIIDMVDDKVDVSYVRGLPPDDLSKVIFPFCGKRCFNTIKTSIDKAANKSESTYTLAQSWDNDGLQGSKQSSIRVLIDWLTTNENCSQYYGGVDEKGFTSADRKETYHYYIRDLIQKENG